MNENLQKILRTIIQVVLLVLLIAYGISGFGITQFRTVEALSFGLISKPFAFQLHDNLVLPFAIFLLLHMFFRPLIGLFRKAK
jgi:TRAP-type C4-dicarboxylate transport system permease small subunit